MGELDPIVGQWYLDLEQDERFKVLALDERGDEVEVEYEDGEIRTLSFDEWYDLDLDVFQEEEEEPQDDVVEPKNDFSRPTKSRRYREEDDDEEDEEDDEELDDDWDDR
ncbi:MAG TPA: DUF6763 family protein [Candidatus Macondimonas sp.]|jgi:hypothetical protein|nr:DUF6763 family protein [Candidatus Macondimonas sp.]